nr:MAG TPA: hypothetical protein [Caudoviricetes sp.]
MSAESMMFTADNNKKYRLSQYYKYLGQSIFFKGEKKGETYLTFLLSHFSYFL